MTKKRARIVMKSTKKIVKKVIPPKNLPNNLNKNTYEKLITILKEEKQFNIQIITLLSLHEFTTQLSNENIKYTLITNETLSNNDSINIFSYERNTESKRNILFSNRISYNYVPIYLKRNEENEEEVKKKNIDIKNFLVNLIKEEVFVLLHVRKKRFIDICSELEGYSDNLNNTTYVLMVLNSLVKKGYIRRTKDNFYWCISNDLLECFAKKYELPLELIY